MEEAKAFREVQSSFSVIPAADGPGSLEMPTAFLSS